MGWQATGWAFNSPIENPGCKFVLVALAERAGNEDDGKRAWKCHPSIETIQIYTSQGYRTVQRHLDWLEAKGFLSRVRRHIEKDRRGAYDFTLNPHECQNGQWPIEEEKGAESGHTEPVKGTNQGSGPVSASDPFEEWWAIYPRKTAKKAARHAWTKVHKPLAKQKLTLADLMDRTRTFAASVVDREPDKIPHGSTWLNGERWTDELPARSQTDGRTTNRLDRAADQHTARVEAMLSGGVEAINRRRRWTLGG